MADYRSDASSDEEGQVSDTDDIVGPSAPRKGGGQLWSEFIQAEKLEEGLKTIPSFEDSSAKDIKIVDRGAESFKITSTDGFDDYLKEERKQRPKVTNPDDLFGDDASQAEEFGVRSVVARKQPELRSVHERIENMSNRERRRWERFHKNSKFAPKSAMETGTPSNRKRRMEEAVSMESLNSAKSNKSEASAGSFGTKRKRNRVKRQKPNNTILRQDFTFDKLYKSTIPSDLSVEDTGERIAKELGERDTTPIKFAVSIVGVEAAVKLFDQTILTEKNGGLQVKFGSRRRTPGGVFFELLRGSDQIHDDSKKQIYEFSRNYFGQQKQTTGSDES